MYILSYGAFFIGIKGTVVLLLPLEVKCYYNSTQSI